MLKLFFLSILILSSHTSIAGTLYSGVSINFKVIEKNDEITLQLHDTIQHPAALEFEDSYQFLSRNKQVVIDLNSGGGSTEEGYKIISFIERLKSEGFTIKTRVQNGRMCGSMCVPIFLSTDRREAAATAAFMFHGVTTGWSTIPDTNKTLDLFKDMKSRGLTEAFEKFLWSNGALSTPGEYWISATDLLKLNSGVITNLLSHHIRKKPIRMPYTPKL